MRKLKSGKNNNENDELELNNDLSDVENGITKDEKTLPEESYNLLIELGQAEKISPKASGMLTWQLAMSETDNELYLRLLANGSGGLFSKDWISLSKIESVLEVQPITGFTSGVFRPLFKGASANNSGFLAAVLRSPDICLLEAHPEKLFTHVLYADWRVRLKTLSKVGDREKNAEG
ncbi:hypothetical protein ACX928_01590 [Enterobacter roggenkampii]|uniref:hypothetical protein n=1 Tax=Enterobacter TaxID=547 RepID=UPI0003BFB872|nr:MULTISPECIES: hypothetical protein [Enterobacter]ELS5730823.1 hypothetical protein [Enterobacter roggenkampii]ELT0932609.1 hypothetical protein [Enterobacter roggenkampii]ESL75715.1 hypothetical protein L423_03392 [Enterobacter roggenkampii]MBQ0301074.1 hypothetical protein [Enterobacter roggenkampii]MCB7502784.1 hypothetical protein [Enterobacter roggenkampii]